MARKTKLSLASFDLPSYENEDRLPTLREMYANLRKKARPQAPEYATLTENTNIDDPDTW